MSNNTYAWSTYPSSLSKGAEHYLPRHPHSRILPLLVINIADSKRVVSTQPYVEVVIGGTYVRVELHSTQSALALGISQRTAQARAQSQRRTCAN